MKIDTLCLGDYQTNCYIVRAEDSRSCAVIDPGYEAGTILAFLKEKGLQLDAILLTHGHFDHVGGVKPLAKETGCKIWMHAGDCVRMKNPTYSFFFPLAQALDAGVCFCEDSEMIFAGGLNFTVMETPGHTPGSVCYRCEDAMFSGDTLFAGSCGRIDLPGGDRKAMLASLKLLSELEEDCRIFPGHGSDTTLSEEKRFNPYLKGIL